jgi:hypothetical protein
MQNDSNQDEVDEKREKLDYTIIVHREIYQIAVGLLRGRLFLPYLAPIGH